MSLLYFKSSLSFVATNDLPAFESVIPVVLSFNKALSLANDKESAPNEAAYPSQFVATFVGSRVIKLLDPTLKANDFACTL